METVDLVLKLKDKLVSMTLFKASLNTKPMHILYTAGRFGLILTFQQKKKMRFIKKTDHSALLAY